MKRLFQLFLAFVGLALFLAVVDREHGLKQFREEHSAGQSVEEPAPTEELSKPKPVSFVPLLTLPSIPSPAQLAAEPRQYLDLPPQSLIEFSQALGTQIQESRNQPKFARRLFAQLAGCVLRDSVPENFRAICLMDAEALGQSHPEELSTLVEQLKLRAPSRVIALLGALD